MAQWQPRALLRRWPSAITCCRDFLTGSITGRRVGAESAGVGPRASAAPSLPVRCETNVAGIWRHSQPTDRGADRDRFAGRHTLVGAGHSAANTLLSLAELAESAPAMT